MRTRARIMAWFVVPGMCLPAPSAGAATVAWWRFESAPGFLADSVGAATLAAAGDAHPIVLPSSGRGGMFPDGFTPTGGIPNLQAAEVDGSGDVLSTPHAAAGNDFTIECFVHMDAATGGVGDTFVTHESDNALVIRFILQARLDGFLGTQVRELVLAGSNISSGFFVGSGIALDLGKDYYVAASFHFTAPSEVKLYVQNLTDGGPLQVATRTHSAFSLPAGSVLVVGGSLISPSATADGLIDEVRYSDQVVPQEELLINQIVQLPQTPALPGFVSLGLAVALGLVALRRVRATRARRP